MRRIARRRDARILDVSGRPDNAARRRSCPRAPARNRDSPQGEFRKQRRPPEGRAPRRLVRAIARRGNGLVAEPPGHFHNAASMRARRRRADGTFRNAP
ncbi:hypothetical protein E6R60_09550 [Streptomyces sp. A0642]|nr:hypothetical protein E6R60_09550 [Streptomyces sp. A0642]